MDKHKSHIRKCIRKLIIIFIAGVFSLAGCFPPGEDRGVGDREDRENNALIDGQMELTLFFPNMSYNPEDRSSEAVIPIRRLVQKTEAPARATVTELLRGPSFMESSSYGVGPIVAANVNLIDIYIKNGICVVQLDYHGLLFSGLPVPQEQAEKFFVQSLVYSLGSLPSVSAVWIFHRERPWQGEFWQYYGPVNFPNRILEYTLYYSSYILPDINGYAKESSLISEEIVLEQRHPFISYTGGLEGPFFAIIDKLAAGSGPGYDPVLPEGTHAVQFELHDGVLTIHLAGRQPAGYPAAQSAIRSLVYTFTELPEIERVIATLNGEPFSDGNDVWILPLSRNEMQ